MAVTNDRAFVERQLDRTKGRSGGGGARASNRRTSTTWMESQTPLESVAFLACCASVPQRRHATSLRKAARRRPVNNLLLV